MNKITVISSRFKEIISNNSPAILTTVAVGGAISTAILTAKATPKALTLLEERIPVADVEERPSVVNIPAYFTKKEIVEICWKEYIPAMVAGGVTVASIIGVNTVQNRRHAALAGLYSIADNSYREYREKVKDIVGPEKEKTIRSEVAKAALNKNGPENSAILLTGRGDVLCLDKYSGRYFRSDIESIRKVVNDLNEIILNQDFVPLNSFYYELGIDSVKMGEEVGWNVSTGMVDINFDSILHEGIPVLVLDYEVSPENDYDIPF